MNWLPWAILSAVFAGITAILAKVGVKDVDSNLATAIRTSVILVFAWLVAGSAIASPCNRSHLVPGYSLCYLVLRLAPHGCATSAHCNLARHRRSRRWTS